MKGSILETVRKPVAVKIGLVGLEYREKSLGGLTLRDRANFILSRCNNPNPVDQTRALDREKGYHSMVPWDIDVHAVTTVPLRKGGKISPDSELWDSTDFGKNRLDLQLTFSGLFPKNERLFGPTKAALFRERLLGRGGPLPDFTDISFLEGAVEMRSPQNYSKKYELKRQYITEYPRPVLSGSDLPMVADEERMQELFHSGGFSDLISEPATTLQNVALAISILPAHSQDIISSLYGIDRNYIEAPGEIGKRLEYSGGEIRKYEKRILEFFNKLNSERNNYIWSNWPSVGIPV